MAHIHFQNDKPVEAADPSQTLLQISLANNIPHIHACGGNARCSTCRVMVHEGVENCCPRNPAEQQLAEKKGFEPNIRLACQTRVTGPVRVRRLVLDDKDAEVALSESAATSGREGKLAILFSDVRNFTRLSEHQLPYDVIHMLNRYFREMGEIVLLNEGYIDKYIGDGLMALWGLENSDPRQNCLNAVRAALQMIDAVNDINTYLKRHFNVTWNIGVGVHFGDVVIGEVGHPRKMQFTAIGDAVNTASRVESATKDASVPLLVSRNVYDQLADHVQTGAELDIPLKGKEGSHHLFEITGLRESADPLRAPDALPRAVRNALRKVISRRTSPLFLRLAYHDAMAYDPATQKGGANGSLRFPEELARPENKGLAPAIDALRPVKLSFPEVSWADLIALAGAVAVAQAQGPEIPIPLGRIDSDTVSPERQLLPRDATIQQMKSSFLSMGFTPREMTALCGAHTLGRADNTPFTDDPFTFTNSYYRLLLRRNQATKSHLLPTDRNLMSCPDCEPHVEAFALDQDLFFREFACAYRKMTLMNVALSNAESPSLAA